MRAVLGSELVQVTFWIAPSGDTTARSESVSYSFMSTEAGTSEPSCCSIETAVALGAMPISMESDAPLPSFAVAVTVTVSRPGPEMSFALRMPLAASIVA